MLIVYIQTQIGISKLRVASIQTQIPILLVTLVNSIHDKVQVYY